MFVHREAEQVASNVFRITLWNDVKEEKPSFFILDSAPATAFVGECACTADASGLYTFSLNGREVLRETDTPFTLGFAISPTDAVYGLGLHQRTAFNRRGTVCQMLQNNALSTAVPFMTSNAGYALLLDTCAFMSIGIDKPCTTEYEDEFHTDESTPNEIHIFADDAATFTYYVILDERIDGQIAAYRALTGRAPLFPKWAYGFFQSRELYGTQEEILAVAREFRRRVFILTRSGWAGQQHYGACTWTGDIDANWEVFRAQVHSLLSFSLSGVPYSTTDIGAFWVRDFPEGNQDPAYRELYTR